MTTENQTTTAAGATQTETHSRVTVETSDREPVAAPAAETTAQAETTEAASGAAEQETEEGQEAGAQEGADEEEGDEGEESQETQPKKPKNGFKKKINKEVSRRKAAEQERDYWRQQALSGQRPQENKTVDPKTENPKAVEWEPKASDFETHEQYIKAQTKWEISQSEKARDAKAKEQAAAAQIQAQVDAFRSSVKEQEAKLPDYRDVVESCDVEPSPVVRQLLLESENGAELTYHLAKNPEELERISKLGPIAAAREMGKFEAKHLSAQKEEPKETKKITKAPPPIKPVGSKTPAASAGFREGMTFAEFKKWRESNAS